MLSHLLILLSSRLHYQVENFLTWRSAAQHHDSKSSRIDIRIFRTFKDLMKVRKALEQHISHSSDIATVFD